MRPHRLILAAAIGLLGVALAGKSVAVDDSKPTIYKWVDENGIAHYTTDKKRVPRNLRNRIRSVEEVKREQEAARSASPPDAEASAAALPDAGVSDVDAPDLDAEPVGDEPFREGPAESAAGSVESAAAPATPDTTPSPATPAAQPSAPRPAPAGTPVGTDIYSVRDADDDPVTSAGSADPIDARDSIFEPEPSEGDAFDAEAAARRDELDARISALEAELARDERRLKELISGAGTDPSSPAPLYGVPELEELARRFPKIQAEIAVLRAERRALNIPR